MIRFRFTTRHPSSSGRSSRVSIPFLSLLLPLVLGACVPAEEEQVLVGQGEGGAQWLSGTVDERFQALGDQLAGFSQTMFEVGLRYQQLYWAVEDENWDLARYGAGTIRSAIERGMIRRPARAESARTIFLEEPLPAFLDALDSGDPGSIRSAFQDLTAACNQCHMAEDMEFVVVGPPPARATAVQPRN